jgi:uncharacterized membrane protein YkoI
MTNVWKKAGFMVLAAALVCTVSYAMKEKEKEQKTLPAKVKDSVAALYPKATMKDFKAGEEEVEVYNVNLTLADGQEVELMLAPDGSVLEIENILKTQDLPFDAAKVLPKNASVKEANSKKTVAVLRPVKLEKSEMVYELEAVVDGKTVEFTVASDGKVISSKTEEKEKECKDNEKEGHEEKDDEVAVSIDQVPAPVKAAILAQGGKIEKIEAEDKDGKKVYEAEITLDGKTVEVKIADNGTLIPKDKDTDDAKKEKKEKDKDEDKDKDKD